MNSRTETDRPVIAYCFADYGVEAEVLSRFGDVHRFTIDPQPNPYCTTTTAMDLMEETPDIEADLWFGHPNCARYCDVVQVSGNREDHEDQIPRARELATAIADEYVIENKPRAPLKDPVVLNGKMFGLNIKYERAFETSFPVKRPPRERELPTEVSPYFYADRTREWWELEKGVIGDYPKEHLTKNALPAPYTRCIGQAWLRHTNERDGSVAQDNNGPAPREQVPEQVKLMEVPADE